METLRADLKLAFRLLRQSPGFAATAIAVIALGIGANTAIFSVVNAVLLKPLPYPEPDRIVALLNSTPQGTFPTANVPKYNNWRSQTQVLEDVAAYDSGGPGINITGGDHPEQARGIHTSYEFFPLFGVPLIMGRSFTPDEDRPRGASVVVISNGLWHRRYAADPSIVGKPISLGGEPYTIIGVVGPGFTFDGNPELYLPFRADPNSTEGAHYFQAAARLKPGVTLQAAQAAMKLAYDQYRRAFPTTNPKNSFTVQPLAEILVQGIRTALYILLGAVVFVLLIACANVANLQLARASVRAREVAIRTALGAGRARIIRQLLTESVLLSLIGGAIGLAFGAVGVRALLAVNPGNIPRIDAGATTVSLDWSVLTFTLGISIVTGLIFGLLPALQVSRTALNTTLKESASRSGSGMRQNKVRAVLVVAEVALAIVLLAGAGLLIRTFAALHSVEPGFDAHNVLTMQLSLTGDRFNHTAAISDLSRQAIERIEALPGVQAAAATSYLPLDSGLGLPFIIEGRPLGAAPAHGGGGWAYVTPRFFDVFRIPLSHGRVFTDRDDAAAPGVVIINEAFVKQYWPKQNPVGQRLWIGHGTGAAFEEPPREIVGIVADARDGQLSIPPQPEMFVPLAQVKDGVMATNNRFMPVSWAFRTAVPPFSLSTPIQQVFHNLADLPLAQIRSMDQIVSGSTASNQFNALLLGIFAALAMLLASIGLYGLMAYTVEQRTLEFGIRLALGADGGALRNMIVGQSMTLAAIGIVIGLAGAFGLTRSMASLLYNVKPADFAVFGSVALILAMVAFLASYLPARRAVKIDPVIALRYE
jgi:putative ABC transport system permease protein